MRVGLCIPIGERGPQLVPIRYREMRELAQVAESGGLDSIWVADHLFIRGGEGNERGLWESLSMLGALAEATSRVELGPLVLCTPFRNPGLIAWAAAVPLSAPGGYLFASAIAGALEVPVVYQFSWNGAAIWLSIMLALSIVASSVPALRATRLSVRESLAYE